MLSIRHRLFILQCATVLITTISLSALSYSLFIPVIFKLQNQQLQQSSREVAKDIDRYLYKLSETLEKIDLEEFHNKYGDLPLEELFVRHFSKLSGTFPLISYLNEQGYETVRLVNSRPSEYFFNLKGSPAVQASLKTPNKTRIALVKSTPGYDRPALQLAITKVGYFGDEFLGTLLITVSADELLLPLREVKLEESQIIFSLVDDKQILLHGELGALFEGYSQPLPEKPERYPFLGDDMFIAMEDLAETPWSVVAAFPYAAFSSQLSNLKSLAALTCLLVTALSVVVSTRLVRHLTRNISLLIDHAAKVGSGDYDQYLELYQDRDFEKLGQAINSMTKDIARHRNSRESLQQIVESIIDPLVVADQQGRIIQVNHATLELFACEESNLVGKPLAKLFSNPPQVLSETSFSSALLRRRVNNLETQIITTDGKLVSVLFSSSPVPGRNIDMGIVGIIKNIDELMNARIAREHALHEAEDAHQRINALLKSVADGLIVTDLSGKVLLHNEPTAKLLGSPEDEVFQNVLKTLPDPSEPGHLPPFDIALPSTENKPTRILQVHSSPVLDHRESQTGMVSVLRDVTRERALEQIKTEFISTAAHELTTPLTSILGYSELLLDHEMEENFSKDQKRDFIEEILNRSESLSKIVDDLLNISRVESGQPVPLDIQPINLEKVLKKTISNYQLMAEKHHFEIKLPDDKKQQPVLVDTSRILQVLENLLSNAVKYSPENTTILLQGDYENNHFKIEISDQGIGMTEEQLERVFDKFYRCDASNTAVGGLGLGMSIVKQIVDGHQGSIQIESELTKGTNVTIRLPLAS